MFKGVKNAIVSGQVDKIEDALTNGCKVTKDDLLGVINGSFGDEHLALVDRLSDLTKVLVSHVESAIDAGNTDVVLCLMKKTSASLKKLHCVAAQRKNVVVFRELMNRGDKCAYDALRDAIGSGCLEIVQDINEQKLIRSLTPNSQLRSAIYYGHKDIIDYLMEKYWTTMSFYGCSEAIRAACNYKRYYLVKNLIDSYPVKRIRTILETFYLSDSIIEVAKYNIILAKQYADYFSFKDCYALHKRLVTDALWKWRNVIKTKSSTRIPQFEITSYMALRSNILTDAFITELKQSNNDHDTIDNFIDFLKNY